MTNTFTVTVNLKAALKPYIKQQVEKKLSGYYANARQALETSFDNLTDEFTEKILNAITIGNKLKEVKK